MEHIKPTVYTIGYSPHTLESFLSILEKHSITALVDVRSQPYSAYRPEYNYKNLKKVMPEKGIQYVFLGRQLGARFEDDSVYIDGRADYDRIAGHHLFHEGMRRLEGLTRNNTVVLMCAEKDPLTCHRTILISRHLKNCIKVLHVMSDGGLEQHEDTEKRLLRLFEMDQPELPVLGRSVESKLEIAYAKQGKKIVYKSKMLKGRRGKTK